MAEKIETLVSTFKAVDDTLKKVDTEIERVWANSEKFGFGALSVFKKLYENLKKFRDELEVIINHKNTKTYDQNTEFGKSSGRAKKGLGKNFISYENGSPTSKNNPEVFAKALAELEKQAISLNGVLDDIIKNEENIITSGADKGKSLDGVFPSEDILNDQKKLLEITNQQQNATEESTETIKENTQAVEDNAQKSEQAAEKKSRSSQKNIENQQKELEETKKTAEYYQNFIASQNNALQNVENTHKEIINNVPEVQKAVENLKDTLSKVNSKDSQATYEAELKSVENLIKAKEKEASAQAAADAAFQKSKSETANTLAVWARKYEDVIQSTERLRTTNKELQEAISSAKTEEDLQKIDDKLKVLEVDAKETQGYLNFKISEEAGLNRISEQYHSIIALSSEYQGRIAAIREELNKVDDQASKSKFNEDVKLLEKDLKAAQSASSAYGKQLNGLLDKLDKFAIKNKNSLEGTSDATKDLKEKYEALRKTITDLVAQNKWPPDPKKIKELGLEIVQLNTDLKDTNKIIANDSTTIDALAASIAKSATLLETKIVDSLYRLGTGILKSIINDVKTLDAALVEVRKVTNFTERELSNFTDALKNVGNETGTMTSKLLEASAVFARSGYTKEQILMLTEEAAILKNVSDGITDMGKAAEVLISVMKAYKVPASEARSITDQLNNISNNAAISFDDLADGIQRVGAVFASTGTSIGELSAMLTGANEVMQSIEKTSNGLKTISERIRSISDVTEDGMGTAKIESLLSTITSRYGDAVHIIDQSNGQLRSTYDILEDLANVWGRLTSVEQQKLGEALAGKNQITVLRALLQNWQGVETAIKNAGDAARGSALVEQEAKMNSLTGALERFQATLENLRARALDSGLVTGIVNVGTTLVKIFGSSGLLTVGVSAVVAKITSMLSPLGKIGSYLEGMGGYFNAIKAASSEFNGNLLKTAVSGSKILKSVTAEQREYAKLLILSQKGLLNDQQRVRLKTLTGLLDDAAKEKVIQIIALEQTRNSLIMIRNAALTAGLSLLINVGLPKILEYINDYNTEINTLQGNIEEINSNISTLEHQIKDIEDTIESSSGAVTQEQLDTLREYNAELREYKQNLAEAQAKLLEKFSGSTNTLGDFSYISYWDKELKRWVYLNEETLKELLDKSEDMTKETYEEIVKYLSNAKPITDVLLNVSDSELNDVQRKLKGLAESLYDVLDEYDEAQKKSTLGLTKETFALAYANELKKLNKEQLEYNDIVELSTRLLEQFGTSGEEALKYLAKLNDEDIDKFYAQANAIDAAGRNLKDYVDLYGMAVDGMSSQQLLNIIDKWSEYADVIEFENGKLKISKDLVVAKAQATVDSTIAELKAQKAVIEGNLARLKVERAALTASNTQAQGVKHSASLIIRAVNQVIDVYEERNKAMGVVTAPVHKVSEYIADNTNRIAELDTTIANLEEQLAFVNQQIDYLENLDVEEYLKKVNKEAGKSSKATSKINKELQNMKNILSALQNQLKETSDVYKQVQEAMKDLVEAEKDGLEAINDELAENIKYYEARIRLIQEALEAEEEAIKAEQKAAQEANEEAQQALEDRIDALKEETEAYEEANQAQQDAIDAQIEELQAQLDAIDAQVDAEEKELKMQEKLLEIEKARLALQKAKDAYEQAKQSKTVRTYDAERGWIYTADQSAVNSAYQEYTSAQQNLDDLLKEYADMLAEAEIQAQKDAIQAQIDALEAEKDVLEDLLEETKENAERQEEEWEKEIDLLEEEWDNLNEFYEQQLEELSSQSSSLDDISDNVERAVDKYLNDTEVLDWFERYMNATEEEREEMLRLLEGDWLTNLQTQEANQEEIDRLDQLIDEIDRMLDVTEYSLTSSQGVQEWLETFKEVSFEDRRAMVAEMHDAYQEFYTAQEAQIARIQDAIDKIEGNISITTRLLQNWGTGNYNTPVNSYATGGVVNSGLLKHTGMLSDYVKVHGTPTNPEVILNGEQQANLLYRLARQIPTGAINNSSTTEGSFYISNLNIQADSQDTLHNLLIQAKQLAMIS